MKFVSTIRQVLGMIKDHFVISAKMYAFKLRENLVIPHLEYCVDA
jgi:hypothetical protein